MKNLTISYRFFRCYAWFCGVFFIYYRCQAWFVYFLTDHEMKAKITKTNAKRLHAYCFWYCEVQYLLRFEDPIFYTSNSYGRQADFYKLEDPKTWNAIRISTGYWPTGDKKRIDYKTTKKYELKAQKRQQKARDWNRHSQKARKKMRSFIFSLIQNANS